MEMLIDRKKHLVACHPHILAVGFRVFLSAVVLIIAAQQTIKNLSGSGNLDLIDLGLWFMFFVNTAFIYWGIPKFDIYENGLDVQFPGKTVFLEWDQIACVIDNPFAPTMIFSPKLGFFHYFIGLGAMRFKPAFVFGKWTTNYRVAMEIIRQNVGEHKVVRW